MLNLVLLFDYIAKYSPYDDMLSIESMDIEFPEVKISGVLILP
jgi:hypothetical protein